MTDQKSAPKGTRRKDSGKSGTPSAALAEARRETAQLKAENNALRDELEQVLANASENEKIWRHFAALERLLFRMRELDRLAEELLREMRVRFQAGQIVLYASHPEIQERLFQGEPRSSSPGDGTWISPMEGEEVRAIFGAALKPVLFSEDDDLPPMFSGKSHEMRSGALIPLNIGEFIFGALLLGSPDPDRYRPGDGTDLLERLGTNIALSMDNCLTYEKVRDLAVQDHLTGLFNFFQIFSLLEREFRRARRSKSPLSILVVDFNFQQDPNDLDTAKEILKHAAVLLDGILPKERSFIGRYGSDQFLAVLPGVPEEEAREVIPYISSAIRKAPFKSGNTAILITTEIGTATLTDKISCAQDLVDAAYAELCSLRSRLS